MVARGGCGVCEGEGEEGETGNRGNLQGGSRSAVSDVFVSQPNTLYTLAKALSWTQTH